MEIIAEKIDKQLLQKIDKLCQTFKDQKELFLHLLELLDQDWVILKAYQPQYKLSPQQYLIFKIEQDYFILFKPAFNVMKSSQEIEINNLPDNELDMIITFNSLFDGDQIQELKQYISCLKKQQKSQTSIDMLKLSTFIQQKTNLTHIHMINSDREIQNRLKYDLQPQIDQKKIMFNFHFGTNRKYFLIFDQQGPKQQSNNKIVSFMNQFFTHLCVLSIILLQSKCSRIDSEQQSICQSKLIYQIGLAIVVIFLVIMKNIRFKQ